MLPYVRIRLVAKRPPPPGYPQNPVTLGEYLRKKRIDLGLTQEDLAARLQVTVGTVCNWEKDHFSPQKRFQPRLHDFLGYCPLSLLCQVRPDLVETAELNRLRDVRRPDLLTTGQIGDRAGHAQDPIQGAG